MRISTIGVLIFLVLFTGSALFETIQYNDRISHQWLPQKDETDSVTQWEERMKAIKDDLPKQGTIGFLADWDIPTCMISPEDQEVEYVLTQYALAPLLVKRGADADFIIGSFSAECENKIESVLDVSIDQTYGNGISLLSKKRK